MTTSNQQRKELSTLLGLDDEGLAACVQCGLCLPHCPTYRATGDERWSPRGRISLMRSVEWDNVVPDDEWHAAMDTCVQCLGCVTACPSGVPYEELINTTRSAIAVNRRLPLPLRVGLWLLGKPSLLRSGSRVLAVFQRLGLMRLMPTNLVGALPRRIPMKAPRRPPQLVDPAEVTLFTGCVMDVWQPEVHAAVEDVLTAIGVSVERSGDRVGCCGALHGHAGLDSEARRHAKRVISTLSGEGPVLVDSAGCGAALKRFGHLLGTPEARAFSERVADVHEWLAEDPRLASFEVSVAGATGHEAVIVQDPCHLRHAQGCHGAVREVLKRHVDLVELDDDGICCGAGGAYSLIQPKLAADAREKKVAAVARATSRSGATLVVSANPGCSMYLGAAGLKVRHPMEVLAQVFQSHRADSSKLGEAVAEGEVDFGG